MKVINTLIIIALAFFIIGCDDEENEEGVTQSTKGWHFQGRDCHACHDSDLGERKNLLIAGTLFKDKNLADGDNMETTCNADLVLNFIDSSGNIVVSSRDYYDSESKGYDGSGNFFILKKYLSALSGEYYMQITDENSNILAVSTTQHSFNAQDYDIENTINFDNTLSCNACHQKNSIQAPLYIQLNQHLCE